MCHAIAALHSACHSRPGLDRFLVQIQELQKEYGGNTEGSEPIKPLAHILLEAKQAKDEAFQNQWKQMKQGMATFDGLLCRAPCNLCNLHSHTYTQQTFHTCHCIIHRALYRHAPAPPDAGKNRPLDEEEVQFVDALEAARRGKEEAERQQELDALEAYQLVGWL